MGKYSVHLIIAILVIIIILTAFPLIVNMESFANDLQASSRFNNSEAYVISMSDTLFKDSAKKLSSKVSPLELKKFDAIKGSELGSVINDKDILTIGALHDIVVPDNRRTHAELGTKNAIGCYLSHTALWTKLMDSNSDGYFIFETDAVCQDNVLKVASEFIATKKDFDILFFGNFWLNIKGSSKFKKIDKRFYGLHAYYITKKGAGKCLKYAFPIEQQIDSYLSDLLLLSLKKDSKDSKTLNISDINFYTVNVCSQNNVKGSSIQTKKVLCNV